MSEREITRGEAAFELLKVILANPTAGFRESDYNAKFAVDTADALIDRLRESKEPESKDYYCVQRINSGVAEKPKLFDSYESALNHYLHLTAEEGIEFIHPESLSRDEIFGQVADTLESSDNDLNFWLLEITE